MTTRVPSTLARLAPAALLGVLLVLPAWFWWATTTASPAQVGIDFGDYWTAATRVAHGTSPYAPEMLAGPVDAMGTDRFRYPPPLAQVLVPLSLLPRDTAYWLFAAVSAVLLVGGTAAGARLAGARPRQAAWIALLLVAGFLPATHSLLLGNVEGLLVALTGAALAGGAATAGGALGVAAMVKLTPAAALPALAARAGDRGAVRGGGVRGGALRGGGRGTLGLAGFAIAVVGVAAISVVTSPAAWADYPTVLRNLLAGSADYAGSLAPAQVARSWLGLDAIAPVIRVVVLGGALGLAAASVVAARRDGAWPVALLASTCAGLLVPAAFWYHYLALLLPFMAMAAVRGTHRERMALVAGIVLVNLLLAPVALAGAIVVAATTLRVLRRPVDAAASPA